MSERDDDLLDAFLADLESAPVPPNIPREVARRLRAEQPARLGRHAGWRSTRAWPALGTAAVALVLVATIGALVGGPGVVPNPSGSPAGTATASSDAHNWTVDLGAGTPIVIHDLSGRLAGAGVMPIAPQARVDPAVVQGGRPTDVIVRFGWSSCYGGGTMTIAADLRSISVDSAASEVPCAGSAGAEAILLSFRDPIDPATVAYTWGSPPPAPTMAWMPPPGVVQTTPTPPPTSSPASATLTSTDAWQLTVAGSGAGAVIGLVQDASGLVSSVAPVAGAISQPPRTAGVSPGSAPNSVIVRAPIEACTQWVSFVVKAGGIDLYPTKSPGRCVTAAGSVAVEIDFGSPATPATMTATMHPYQFYTTAIQLSVMALAQGQDQRIFLGGQDSGAAVATSLDGGRVWGLQHLGGGRVSGLGTDGDGALWISVFCDPTQWDHCGPGLYRSTPGATELTDARRVLSIQPVSMAVDGQGIAALGQPDVPDVASLAWPPRRLWLSEDGGQTWTNPALPCDARTSYASSVSFDLARRLVVLCEGSGTGTDAKYLFRADDPPTGAWTELPNPPRLGSAMTVALTALDRGWLFGYGSPLLVTRDSGASWSPEPRMADGRTRWVTAGQPWPSGGGLAMVVDQDRQGSVLLRSVDGTSWTELAAFPDPPCCGG